MVQRGNSASRLVIIDDGSKDNTRAILEKCRQSRPLLEVHTKVNGGHGAAVLYGYKYALSQGADYIFQTDSDGQTIPSELRNSGNSETIMIWLLDIEAAGRTDWHGFWLQGYSAM